MKDFKASAAAIAAVLLAQPALAQTPVDGDADYDEETETGEALSGPPTATASPEAPSPDAPPQASVTPTRNVGLTDIVVTARRREEPLQRTPVAVSAITSADIAAKHATTIVGLANSIPNVRIDAVGSQGRVGMLSIRGVNYARPDQTGDPSVAFYVDGLYQTRSTINILDLFDIESIEVLRGPQGTLFGRNAFAGAVNIQSKRPDFDRIGGEVQATVANYGRYEVRGALNVPLTDNLAMRASAYYGESDGYYNLINEGGKSFGGDENLTGKLSFLWEPDDSWSIFAKYERVRDDSEPTPNKNSSLPTQLFGNLPNDPPNIDIGGPYDVNFNLPDGQDSFVDIDSVVLNVTKEIEGLSINLISGYQSISDGLITDPGSGNQPYLNSYYRTNVDVVSQEARFIKQIGDVAQLMAGLYYQRDELDYGAITYSTYGPLLGTNSQVDTKQDRDSYAVFAELELRPIEDVRVNLAGRQQCEDKDFSFLRRVRSPNMDFAEFLPKPDSYDRDKESWKNFSPKISVDWQATEDMLLYASWTKGFKSGGYASIATSLAIAGPYNPEKIETYEVGLKSYFFDRRVRLNVAAFWNNIDDLQRQVNFLDNGVINNLVFNAASAVTRGVEAELETRPVEGLTLRAAGGYTDAYYDEFCAAFGLPGTPCNDGAGTPGAVDNSDLKLYNAPEWQFSAGGNYAFDVGNIGTFTIFGDVNYTSSLFTTDNNLDSKRDPLTLVDASVRWTSVDERLYASVFVQNLFDEIELQQQIRAGGTLSILNYTPPRRYGATVGFKF